METRRKREWRENTRNTRIPVRQHVNSIDNHAMGNCVSVKQEFLHLLTIRFAIVQKKKKEMKHSLSLCLISIPLSYGRKTRMFLKFVNLRLVGYNFVRFVNSRYRYQFLRKLRSPEINSKNSWTVDPSRCIKSKLS